MSTQNFHNASGGKQYSHDARVRVRYAETDQMGVVYHGNYLTWFEVGRVELMRSLGFDYREMDAEHVHIAVVEASARYKSPARYDDELIIRTVVKMQRSFLLKFGYQVIRENDGTLLCEGETTHVVCNSEMKKTPMPEKYAERFRQLGIEE